MDIHYQRLQAIRAMMNARGWDALVLTGSDPHSSEYVAPRWKQVEWVTGYDGEGDIVITADHAGLWTDSRYFIAAEAVLPGSGFTLHKTRVPDEVGIPAWLAAQAAESGGDEYVVAIDGRSHSALRVGDIGDAAPVRIVSVPDILDFMWEDRPMVPQTPIITLGDDFTGESRISKIEWLRAWLRERGCDAMLIGALDEVAWMLNVRGQDIDYNPLVMSYLIVYQDKVEWYVLKGGEMDSETRDSLAELRADGVRILHYDEILPAASSLGDELRLFADKSTLGYELCEYLSSGGCELVWGDSPVPLRKAVKNPVQIEGMKEAHFADGLVMEKFLYWLEKMVSAGERISEGEAARKLGSLRAEIPEYRGDSFETISAYGPHAALPHYVIPEDGGAILHPSGLYLCDSGGQYLSGTTDITRTVPLGPVSRLEAEDYTLVLKGHIDLCTAIFPENISGCHLDVLARGPLWRSKRNYGHGTGHGVGSFLGVHEGPQDVRCNYRQCPLVPGMILTDEPGIYREGMHGVRHENVLLVVPAGRNEFARWYGFEPLTLCHFDTAPLLRDLLSEDEVQWINDYNAMVYSRLSGHLPAAVASWLRDKTRPI